MLVHFYIPEIVHTYRNIYTCHVSSFSFLVTMVRAIRRTPDLTFRKTLLKIEKRAYWWLQPCPSISYSLPTSLSHFPPPLSPIPTFVYDEKGTKLLQGRGGYGSGRGLHVNIPSCANKKYYNLKKEKKLLCKKLCNHNVLNI